MLAPFNDTFLLQWVAAMQQSSCPLNVTQVFWHLQAWGCGIEQGPWQDTRPSSASLSYSLAAPE